MQIPNYKIESYENIYLITPDNFKRIPGYENIYMIDFYGTVFSIKKGKILKQETTRGYKRVTLSKNGKTKRYLVHRLVATVFLPNTLNKKYVNHKDGNKINNNVLNLEWVTASENEKHSYSVLNKINHNKKLILNLENGIFYEDTIEASKIYNIKYSTCHARLSGINKNSTSLIYV